MGTVIQWHSDTDMLAMIVQHCQTLLTCLLIFLLTPRHAPAPVAAVKALQQGRPRQLGAARAGEPHRLPDLVVELHLDTTCQTYSDKDTDL